VCVYGFDQKKTLTSQTELLELWTDGHRLQLDRSSAAAQQQPRSSSAAAQQQLSSSSAAASAWFRASGL